LTGFRYRAATPTGQIRTGLIEAASQDEALGRLRRQGLAPIEATPSRAQALPRANARPDSALRQALINALGELAVLLGAGLTLERALALGVENADRTPLKAALAALLGRIKEGWTLSRAMQEGGALFPPLAPAMVAAGEANGRLDQALARLAQTLDRAEALRRSVVSALIYPCLLLAVAVGVICVMLLIVIPQFETLFSDNAAQLPLATRVVMGASHALRAWGLVGILALAGLGLAVRAALQRPKARLWLDRALLAAPGIGPLTTKAEVARFARVLAGLIDGGVTLSIALPIAQRSIGNTRLAAAVAQVASGLKEGGGLSGPLAATGLFPTMALSFLRTGEETACLGLMLERLADVLDRDVKTAVDRLMSLLTPVVTLAMAVMVGGIVASIISAILGFDDLAVTS
jgi:general secretion pathway protein F